MTTNGLVGIVLEELGLELAQVDRRAEPVGFGDPDPGAVPGAAELAKAPGSPSVAGL